MNSLIGEFFVGGTRGPPLKNARVFSSLSLGALWDQSVVGDEEEDEEEDFLESEEGDGAPAAACHASERLATALFIILRISSGSWSLNSPPCRTLSDTVPAAASFSPTIRRAGTFSSSPLRIFAPSFSFL